MDTLGYSFRDPSLLEEALTHPSLGKKRNNQRLEFLGDAVLGMLVSRLLFDLFPKETEGELARRQAALVCGPTLAQVAKEARLGAHLRLANSEEAAGGRDNPTNLEDACEALIGALYIDGGIEAAAAFVLPRWEKLAKSLKAAPKDAKTSLQEWAQARGLPVPSYTVLESEGPAHAPVFTIEARVQGYEPVTATAPNKRAAEQSAAAELLGKLA